MKAQEVVMLGRLMLVFGGIILGAIFVGVGELWAAPALVLPRDVTGCTADMVRVGSVCVDKYEASVWDTAAGTGTQYGVSSDNYPCIDDGNNCTGLFALSRSGVTPSTRITWFQAQQACRNVGKKLISNDDWQAAAAGTPDSTQCNVSSGSVANTGAFANCKSRWDAFDMVGNVWEWVAEWVAQSTTCGTWSGAAAGTAGSSGDLQCLAGAATMGEPGALIRGGVFNSGAAAGVFAVRGNFGPSSADSFIGFRCAR